jgi:acetyltransferase-like isoleucine patch superfamily enzyme
MPAGVRLGTGRPAVVAAIAGNLSLRIKNVRHPNNRPPFEDPLQILPRGLTKMYSLWVSMMYPFASIGRNVSFHFTNKVSRQRAPRISLGNSVRLLEYAWLNVATEDLTGEPTIVIDDDCSIGYASIISAKNHIHLERDILIGQHVVIQDHSHAYEDLAVPIIKQGVTKGGRIRIGEGSWIGRGAAILCSRGELTIGRHCVVSANSVVTRSIPDYSVVFGMPATIIRQYDPETRTWRMGQLRGGGAADRENIEVGSVGHETDLMEKTVVPR